MSENPSSTGEVRTVSSTGAAKGVKPEAFDLIPTGPLDILASFYGTDVVDFEQAEGWEPLFNYAEEHLSAFWRGEDTDPATHLPHLVCAAAALAKLVSDDTDIGTPSGARYTPLVVTPVQDSGGASPLRYDRIPAQALFVLGRHYAAGAVKYAAHNWAAGYEWSKPYAAMQRHLWTAQSGEHIDAETGSPHLVAVLWHCLTMAEFLTTHSEFDDRPVRGTSDTVLSLREKTKKGTDSAQAELPL